MKKIGLLGGTFNPVHYGHLRSALEVCEHFDMDKLFFIPTYITPYKRDEEIVAPEVRLKMLDLAVRDFLCFEVNDMEIMRENVSYSVDTVSALRESEPDARIYFILGSDAFAELGTWIRYDELIFMCDFVVMTRPGAPEIDIKKVLPDEIRRRFKHDKTPNLWISDVGTSIFFFDVTPLDISSTRIRELIREKNSINGLLPESVGQYISDNGLYLHQEA